MLTTVLAALVWFPQFGASVEVGHDLGLEPDLKGSITFDLSLGVVKSQGWQLEIRAGNKTYVRENRRNETMFRISPQQIHYPVGARLRFPMKESGQEWALFVRHQSNHDIDTNDAVLNRETISFEVYGVQFLGPHYTLEAGLYYDRGTRLDETQQNWPFNYFLGGARAQFEWSPNRDWYAGFDGRLIGHRNESTAIPYVDVGGYIDVGWQFWGKNGRARTFIRAERLNNYQYLGDTPRHLLLLGLGVDGRIGSPITHRD